MRKQSHAHPGPWKLEPNIFFSKTRPLFPPKPGPIPYPPKPNPGSDCDGRLNEHPLVDVGKGEVGQVGILRWLHPGHVGKDGLWGS